MGPVSASRGSAKSSARRHDVPDPRFGTTICRASGPRSLLPVLLAGGLLGLAAVATAQVDTEPRTYLELGAEGPLRGNGGDSGYAFLLLNRPHFLAEDLYGRLVVAPTYLNSELVRDGWPAAGHAIGVGVNGGLFQNDFDEFRHGQHKKRESFDGDGGEASLTYYRHITIGDRLPIEGQLRLKPGYV